MKIRVRHETMARRPIPGVGIILTGDDPVELVALMQMETPFAADLTPHAYMTMVLRRVEGQDCEPLPAGLTAATTAFFDRLAAQGRIEFLTDTGPAAEPVTPPATKETDACAAK